MTDTHDTIKVLDDGFVKLVAHMGHDDAIAQAARVSYAAGTKTKRDNEQLIRFLMRHQHYSPFGQCQVQFHLRLPIFIHNQFVRHDRFTWNMMSGRYSVMPEEKWSPTPSTVRGQGEGNKQVGDGSLDLQTAIATTFFINFQNDHATEAYNELLEAGVCREQARTVLPMGQYTEGVVTANLGDWMLFLRQRLDPHAQAEIRVYAEAIAKFLEALFPVAMQAFYDYQLNAVTFSAAEMSALKSLLRDRVLDFEWLELDDDQPDPDASWERIAVDLGGQCGTHGWVRGGSVDDWIPEQRKQVLEQHIPTQRERQEFWKKISA